MALHIEQSLPGGVEESFEDFLVRCCTQVTDEMGGDEMPEVTWSPEFIKGLVDDQEIDSARRYFALQRYELKLFFLYQLMQSAGDL